MRLVRHISSQRVHKPSTLCCGFLRNTKITHNFSYAGDLTAFLYQRDRDYCIGMVRFGYLGRFKRELPALLNS